MQPKRQDNSMQMQIPTASSCFALLFLSPPNHIPKVQPSLTQHISMSQRRLHASLVRLALAVHTTQLSPQQRIELIHMLLRPLGTRRHHGHGEAGLVDEDRVLDRGKVDEAELVNVRVEVAFEDALSVHIYR